MRSLLFSMFFLASCMTAPSWVKQPKTTFENGKLRIVCDGKGITAGHARSMAISECKKSASDYFSNNIEVSKVLIQTNENTSLNSQISHHAKFSNLKCVPLGDYVQKTNNEQIYWIICEFDENLVELQEESEEAKNLAKKALQTTDQTNVVSEFNANNIQNELSDRTIVIATIPQCKEIIIEGPMARIIPCQGNPVFVLINKLDKNIRVSAEHYIQKNISVSDVYTTNQESFSILLDPI